MAKVGGNDPAKMEIIEPNSGNQDCTNKYWTINIIGAASGATVYRAMFFPSIELPSNVVEALPDYETFVAIKVLNVNQTTEILKLKQELQESAFLADHPNIIPIKTEFIVDDNHYVVMPFMAGGSLQSIISSRFPDGFPEEYVRIVLRETLKGLSYIHQMGQLHKYVDARYIFLCPDTPAIRLAFGASLYEQDDNYSKNCTMPLRSSSEPYCLRPAPEDTVNHTIKADVWLFGITALQLRFGVKALNDAFLETMIRSGKESMPGGEEKFSGAFRDMVATCLDPEPSRRPETEELLSHGFFDQCRDVTYFSNFLCPNPTVYEPGSKELRSF